MGTTAQEAGSGSPTSAMHGSQLVVRNTFLELTEDADLDNDNYCGLASAPRRARALTDLTDHRSPQKEEYPVDCCLQDGRGDATPSTVADEVFNNARLPKVDSESCLVESEFKLSGVSGRRWCDEVATDFDEVGSPWGIDSSSVEAMLPAATTPPCPDAAGAAQAWAATTDMQYMMYQQGMAAWWGCPSGPGFSTPGAVPHIGMPILSQAPAGAAAPMSDATRQGSAAALQPPPQKPPQPTVCVKLDSILNLEPADSKEKAPASKASRKKGARNRGGSQEPPRGSQGGSAGATEPCAEGKPMRQVKTAPGQLDKMAQEKAETPTKSTEKQRKQSKAQQPQPKQPQLQEPQRQQPEAAATQPEPPQAEQPLSAEPAKAKPPREEEDTEKPQVRAFESIPLEQQTTVMLRNIPNQYTQTMLLSLLSDHGFGKSFDFVYLPMDFRNGVNLGYAFVNLAKHEDALQVMEVFQAYGNWAFECSKLCEVSWAHPHQGLHEHVERYRNSPVMHPCMPDEYKPMLFSAGERVAFPEPTRPIRPPKLRPAREKMAQAQAEGLLAAPPPVAAMGA